jgi:hypothetical protein
MTFLPPCSKSMLGALTSTGMTDVDEKVFIIPKGLGAAPAEAAMINTTAATRKFFIMDILPVARKVA